MVGDGDGGKLGVGICGGYGCFGKGDGGSTGGGGTVGAGGDMGGCGLMIKRGSSHHVTPLEITPMFSTYSLVINVPVVSATLVATTLSYDPYISPVHLHTTS